MAMRMATELSTKLIDGISEDEVPVSEILLNGDATGVRISGAILETAVRWEDFYLLFMTDDIPFEEMLSIHLLDARLSLLDSASIGGPYSSGSFSLLELREPNIVRFRFIGDTDWDVELFPEYAIRLPLLAVEPPGVHRSFGVRRHFMLHGAPRPQTAGHVR